MLTAAQSIAPAFGGLDEISTRGGRNVIFGGAGADWITVQAESSAETNILFGDSGIAQFDLDSRLQAVSSLVNAAGGNDQITLTGGTNTVIAGGGSDAVTAITSKSVIFGDEAQAEMTWLGSVQRAQSLDLGKGGNDQITLLGGENMVVAGAGDDEILSLTPIQLSASIEVTDFIFADEAQVSLAANDRQATSLNLLAGGNDRIENQSNRNQIIVGGSGSDRLTTQNDADLLIGQNAQIRSLWSQIWQSDADPLPGQPEDNDLLSGGKRTAKKK